MAENTTNFNTRSIKIDAKAISDFTVVGLQYPLRWFWSTSSKKGSIPQEFNIDLYEAAKEIQLFSRSYIPFESVYTLASRKRINLLLEDDLIKSESPYLIDSRYEAYDALRDFASPEEVSDSSSISEMIYSSVTISDNRFHYQLGRRLISKVLDFLTPLFLGLYELPNDWKFDHEFHDYVCAYAAERFSKGYEMGKRHGEEGKVKPLNDEALIKAIEENLKHGC